MAPIKAEHRLKSWEHDCSRNLKTLCAAAQAGACLATGSREAVAGCSAADGVRRHLVCNPADEHRVSSVCDASRSPGGAHPKGRGALAKGLRRLGPKQATGLGRLAKARRLWLP